MPYYIYYHNHIIVLEGNNVMDIIDPKTNNSKKRLGSKDTKIRKNDVISVNILNNNIYKYDSLDILKNGNNICYDIKTGTGEYKHYYNNGNIEEEYYQINFKKEGIYKKYFISGNIKIECYYINDCLHGTYKEYKWNDNYSKNAQEDIIKKIYQYDMNKLSGKCIDYPYHNENYYEEYNYVNNIRNGEYKIVNFEYTLTGVYENGIVINKIKTDIHNNILLKENKINEEHNLVNIYVNNILQEVYEKNSKTDKKDGFYKKYFDIVNNKIRIECNYKNNYLHGKYKEYYIDGNIKIQTEYQNEKIINNYIEYYPNNKIKMYITYDGDIEKKKVYNSENKLIEYYIKTGTIYKINFKLNTISKDIYDEFIKELNLTI